jgi:hypothetical protein
MIKVFEIILCMYLKPISPDLIQNTLNDKHFDDIVYDDPDRCELLNKYFTQISKLNEDNKSRI